MLQQKLRVVQQYCTVMPRMSHLVSTPVYECKLWCEFGQNQVSMAAEEVYLYDLNTDKSSAWATLCQSGDCYLFPCWGFSSYTTVLGTIPHNHVPFNNPISILSFPFGFPDLWFVVGSQRPREVCKTDLDTANVDVCRSNLLLECNRVSGWPAFVLGWLAGPPWHYGGWISPWVIDFSCPVCLVNGNGLRGDHTILFLLEMRWLGSGCSECCRIPAHHIIIIIWRLLLVRISCIRRIWLIECHGLVQAKDIWWERFV